MKTELESIQSQLVKFGCDPLTGASNGEDNGIRLQLDAANETQPLQQA